MPYLDPEQALRLLGKSAEPDAELDLRGLPPEVAMERLRRLADNPALPGPRRYAVRIDPPVPGGGETLFQPVGRYLLDARREGRVERFAPLAEPPGGGYFVDLGQ
jgi:hypothetical protein